MRNAKNQVRMVSRKSAVELMNGAHPFKIKIARVARGILHARSCAHNPKCESRPYEPITNQPNPARENMHRHRLSYTSQLNKKFKCQLRKTSLTHYGQTISIPYLHNNNNYTIH